MKITLEDAESWYRGDQDQNVSAHQVAVFYRGEASKLRAKLDFYEKIRFNDEETNKSLEDTEQCLDQGVAIGDDNAEVLARALRSAWKKLTDLKPLYHNWHEEGGGLIISTRYGFILYAVPQYGGEPMFSGHYKTLDEAKKEADKWT